MADTIEVQTKLGTFELKRPKAGVRNRAMMKAETDSGNVRQIVLMTELLPRCVNKRPEAIDQDTPIEQILDDLEIEDYDKMFIALSDIIGVENLSEEKKTKLEGSSTTDSSPSPSKE